MNTGETLVTSESGDVAERDDYTVAYAEKQEEAESG